MDILDYYFSWFVIAFLSMTFYYSLEATIQHRRWYIIIPFNITDLLIITVVSVIFWVCSISL